MRRTTQKDKKERVCYSDNLVNINGMRVLFEVYNEIKTNVKYWVEGIDIGKCYINETDLNKAEDL